METIAKERKLKNRWVCMACNHTMRSPKKMEFCNKCGATRIRAKKKGKNVK